MITQQDLDITANTLIADVQAGLPYQLTQDQKDNLDETARIWLKGDCVSYAALVENCTQMLMPEEQ